MFINNSKKKNSTKVKNAKHQDDTQKYFLSLGAGHNQLSLIKAAHDLGYKVIAVDKNAKAPGFSQANLHIYCSILKPKKILQNLQKNIEIYGELKGIGCRSFGRANYSAAIIAKNLSIPGPAPDNLNLFHNKAHFKQLMHKLNIPTAPSCILNKKSKNSKKFKQNWHKNLPLIARPVVGHAKQGIKLLEKEEDMVLFLKNNSLKNEFLLDKYIKGKEINIIGLVCDGIFTLVCATEKHVIHHSSQFIELEHRYPINIKTKTKQKICAYIQKICDYTDIKNSPFVAEFIINENNPKDNIYIIECSPESGGEYLADYLIPVTTGIDYFQELVKICTGQKANFRIDSNKEKSLAMSIRFIAQKNGTLKTLKLPSSLIKNKNLVFYHYLKKPGDKTSLAAGNVDRLAVFGIKSPITNKHHHQEVENIAKSILVEYEN